VRNRCVDVDESSGSNPKFKGVKPVPPTLVSRRYALALTGAAAAWGVATVIAKRALTEIPPLTLLPIQLGISVAILTTVLVVQRQALTFPAEVRRLGLLGVLNPGISYALGLIGLTFIAASLSVLLWATEPIMILLLAWLVLGDRITKRVVVGALLALAGVLLVVFEPGSQGQPVGVALTLLGVAACAVYTVVTKKWMVTESTLQVVALQQASALVFAVLLLAVSALVGYGGPSLTISVEAWVSALISGALYYAAAFWLYLTGLRRINAATAGLYINLIPVFGIAASYALLGERLNARQWLGAILIVATMFVVIRNQSAASPQAAPTLDDLRT
jgi:probable blue pigment (indigoidine) exporter